ENEGGFAPLSSNETEPKTRPPPRVGGFEETRRAYSLGFSGSQSSAAVGSPRLKANASRSPLGRTLQENRRPSLSVQLGGRTSSSPKLYSDRLWPAARWMSKIMSGTAGSEFAS